jgi:hypothetical protein
VDKLFPRAPLCITPYKKKQQRVGGSARLFILCKDSMSTKGGLVTNSIVKLMEYTKVHSPHIYI